MLRVVAGEDDAVAKNRHHDHHQNQEEKDIDYSVAESIEHRIASLWQMADS
jgi:hypothetical protein